MGLDVPSIRHVFLYGMPRSPSETWQMIGRCGRDGERAVAHFFFKGKVDESMQPFVTEVRTKTIFLIFLLGEVLERKIAGPCFDLCGCS